MPRAPNARSCALPRVPRPQLEEARALCDEAISPLMTLSGPAGAWRLPRGSTRSASAELPTRFRERSGTFLRDRDRRGWTASGPRGSSRRWGGRTEPASSDCDSRQQSPEGGGRGMRRLVPGRGAMQEVGRKPVCSGWEGWRADAVLSDRTTVAVREVDPWGLPLLRDRQSNSRSLQCAGWHCRAEVHSAGWPGHLARALGGPSVRTGLDLG